MLGDDNILAVEWMKHGLKQTMTVQVIDIRDLDIFYIFEIASHSKD